jgi:nucleotide-binding universal stress UspA family protein
MPSSHLSILVVYASAADDDALDQAIALAVSDRARLTVAVPVVPPHPLTSLAFVDLQQLRVELEQEAVATSRRAAARVPDDVSLVVRCVPRQAERALLRELADGAYDLCVGREGRTDPGTLWDRMGLRLARAASRNGVPTVLVSRSPAPQSAKISVQTVPAAMQ